MMITRCLSIKATVVIVLALICLLPIIILSNHSAIRSKINSFRKPNLVHQNYKKFDLHGCDPAVYLKALRMHQFNLAIAPKTPIIFHGDQIEVVKQCPLNQSVFEVQSAESANDAFAERTAPGKLNATCENGILDFEKVAASVECASIDCLICAEKIANVRPFDCTHAFCEDCANNHEDLVSCPICTAQREKKCTSDPAKLRVISVCQLWSPVSLSLVKIFSLKWKFTTAKSTNFRA
eukprot:598446_1